MVIKLITLVAVIAISAVVASNGSISGRLGGNGGNSTYPYSVDIGADVYYGPPSDDDERTGEDIADVTEAAATTVESTEDAYPTTAGDAIGVYGGPDYNENME